MVLSMSLARWCQTEFKVFNKAFECTFNKGYGVPELVMLSVQLLCRAGVLLLT